jgi:hypothetical protein
MSSEEPDEDGEEPGILSLVCGRRLTSGWAIFQQLWHANELSPSRISTDVKMRKQSNRLFVVEPILPHIRSLGGGLADTDGAVPPRSMLSGLMWDGSSRNRARRYAASPGVGFMDRFFCFDALACASTEVERDPGRVPVRNWSNRSPDLFGLVDTVRPEYDT